MAILDAFSFTNTDVTYFGLEVATIGPQSISFVSGGGRFAGDSLRLGPAGNGNLFYIGDNMSPVTDIAVYFARKTEGLTGAEIIFRWLDGSSDQIDLRISTSGQLSVTRNGTVLGTSGSTVLAVNVPYGIGFRVKFDNSSGTIDVWVDTVNVIHLTGQDTQATGNATADNWRLQGQLNGNTFSDLVLIDTTGSLYNNYAGEELRCDDSLPASDAGTNQGTPSSGSNHAAMVDEVVPNGDTDYNSILDSQREMYNMAAISGLTGTIWGVSQKAIVRKTDAGSVRIKHVLESSSVNDVGSAISVTSGYRVLKRVVEVDPNTSSAFTWTNLNVATQGIDVLIP